MTFRLPLATTALLFLLIALLISPAMGENHCPSLRKPQDPPSGLLGGYSAPRPPTPEERFELKRLWFEAHQKCAHIPEVRSHDTMSFKLS